MSSLLHPDHVALASRSRRACIQITSRLHPDHVVWSRCVTELRLLLSTTRIATWLLLSCTSITRVVVATWLAVVVRVVSELDLDYRYHVVALFHRSTPSVTVSSHTIHYHIITSNKVIITYRCLCYSNCFFIADCFLLLELRFYRPHDNYLVSLSLGS
jgi:hypothetical protein